MRKNSYLLLLLLISTIDCYAQIIVKFELNNIPKNKDVDPSYFLSGNFNGWKPNDTAFKFVKEKDGQYTLSKKLPATPYEFKVTRGAWTNVETGVKGNNRSNRTLKLARDTTVILKVLNWADEFKVIPPNHTASKQVRLLDSAFIIPQLNAKRRIWIYLPSSYELGNKHYPVLYMHDGQNLFDEYVGGYGEWGVDEFLDAVVDKKAEEYIVVAIANDPVDRMKEYNPYDSQYGKGKGKPYVEFLVKTLKPYVDKNYRTKTDAKHTAIAGSSMGGLISLYAVATYPQVYGKAGIFSPAFWVGRKIEDDLKSALPNLKRNQIYFVAGTLEGNIMIRDMNSAYQILNPDGKNKNIKLIEKPDGEHKEWFWRREFADFYKFISK